jgi:Tfp pilus assembly protein PilF
MLSDTYNMLAYYRFADPYEMRKRSSEAATKALALDDNIPETYIALAFLKGSEKDGMKQAKELVEKAISIAPYNSTARVRYGWQLLGGDDLNGAVEQMHLAQHDPTSAVKATAKHRALGCSKAIEEAIKYCENR